jgi:hypothetical protein
MFFYAADVGDPALHRTEEQRQEGSGIRVLLNA